MLLPISNNNLELDVVPLSRTHEVFEAFPGPLKIQHLPTQPGSKQPTMSALIRDVYLVIGGSGFLGRHIVEALVTRGDTVSVFDIVQRYHDVPFYSGDISEEGQVGEALQRVIITPLVFYVLLVLIFFTRVVQPVSYTPHPHRTAWMTRLSIGKLMLMVPRP